MKKSLINSVKIFILFFFALGVILHAQSASDSTNFFFPAYKINGIKIASDKHLNTLNFRNDLYYQGNYGKVNFAVDGKYSSAYFFATQQSYRTSHVIKTFADYSFSDWLAAGLLVKRSSYNDNQRLAISSAEVNQAMLYSKINVSGVLNLTPIAGFSQNSQAGAKDAGPIYGIEGNVNRISMENLDLSGRFHYSNEDISPRKNTLRSMLFQIRTSGSRVFRNTLSASFDQSGKDFYLPLDSTLASVFGVNNNIESRTENNYLLSNELQIYFSPRSRIDIGGYIKQKYVKRQKRYVIPDLATTSTFDPTVSRLLMNITTSFVHRTSDYRLLVKGGFNRREETFSVANIPGANAIFYDLRQSQESNKDNVSALEYFTGSFRCYLGTKNVLSLSLYQRKLRYDTPSEENFDDRDELLTMLRFGFQRKVNPFFIFRLGLEASRNHLVYVFAERSSNNNIKRILRLIGGGTYRGKRLTSSNSAEVSANYTVYDFEDLTQNYQSFAFRQFSAKDSTSLFFNKFLSANFFGYIKISEQGEFSWKNFSEKPFQYRTEIYVEPLMQFNTRLINVGLGLRYYSLQTYDYSVLQLFPVSDYTSIGPSMIAATPISNNFSLNFHGWYEFVKSGTTPDKTRINFTFSFYWMP